ncbi:MAG: FHA domain-containing protein [Clostridia bacterium]
MNDTAYSIAASIFSYVFMAIIAYMLVRLVVLSLAEYRENKKARIMQKNMAAGRIEFLSPENYAGNEFLINRETIVGRSRGADIVIPDKGVSKRHCVIFERKSGIYIADYGSKLGTFVNGEKLFKHDMRLKSGDIVSIAEKIAFKVTFDGEFEGEPEETFDSVEDFGINTMTYGEEGKAEYDKQN